MQEDLQDKLQLISTEITGLFKDTEALKQRMQAFASDIMKLEDTLKVRLNSIVELVDNKMMSDAEGVKRVNEASPLLKEYTALMVRFGKWLRVNNVYIERVNAFHKEHFPLTLKQQYFDGRITLKELTQKFEAILNSYRPIANEFLNSHDALTDFENEYHELLRKANASVN